MKKPPIVVGITGHKECGKDTFAQTLVDDGGYTRIAFGDEIKRDVAIFLGITDCELERRKVEFRATIQEYGQRRKREESDYWICQLDLRWNMQHLQDKIVVPDVRFADEADWVRDQDGVIIRVIKTDENGTEIKPDDDHVTEREFLTIQPDYIVVAPQGDLTMLRRKALWTLEGRFGMKGAGDAVRA